MTVVGNAPHGLRPLLPKVRRPRVVGSLTWGENNRSAMIALAVRNGDIFFRNEKASAEELPAKIRRCVNHGSERRVYIRADARARYASVNAVLKATQSAGVADVSFLVDALRVDYVQ